MKDGRTVRLKQLYDEIETLNDEIPAELNRKIKLYSQALMLIGYFDSDALKEYMLTYAARKQKEGEVKASFKGTGVEKEGQTEIAIYELRKREAETKADSRKWTNLFKSTEQIIIALRREEQAIMAELQHSDGTGGKYN